MAKIKRIITDPLSKTNPITWLVLGVCSALAVTTKVETALVMAASLTIVTAFSNLIISLLRNYIPGKIRMIVELCIIATLVILADMIIKAFIYSVSKELSIFVGLIITNCIVMGRAEAFALHNPPIASFLDGIGNGLGYGIVLFMVASIREILGTGNWFGIELFNSSEWYQPNLFMILPPGAFIVIGLLIWFQRTVIEKQLREEN